MRADVIALCRRPAALGFGLAGLACHEVPDGAAAAEVIARIVRGAAPPPVILIERALHDALPTALLRQLRRDGVPVLMPFPGPSIGVAAAPPEEELVEILRRSIGYRLRLR